MNNLPKIKYAISSNTRYKDITLPILLNSLFESGISRHDIVVVVSLSSENYIEIKDNIYYIYTNSSSYDLSTFREISNRELQSDFWFMLPDTSKVGNNFKNLIETKSDFSKNVNAPYFQAIGSIGLFKMQYLIDNKHIFKKFKNIPSYVAGAAEGIAWLLADRLPEDKNDDCIYYPDHGFDLISESDIYGNGIMRVTHYLPSIDLYKYMSNFKDRSLFKHNHNL